MTPGMYARKPLDIKFKDILQAGECKLIGVQGITGVGKSSFITAFLRAFFKNNALEHLYGTYKDILELRYKGFNVLPPVQPHTIYSTNTVYLDTLKEELGDSIRTFEIELDEIGLPNLDYKTVDLPYGAILFFDEAHGKLNNRQWHNFSMWLLGFLTYHRHRMLTLVFCTQDLNSLDVIIRDRLHVIYYITDRYQFSYLIPFNFHKFIGYDWRVIKYYGTRDIIHMGVNGVIPPNNLYFPYVSYCKFKTYEDVHSYYDSFAGRFLFFHSNMKFNYNLHNVEDPNATTIDAYVKKHGFTMNSTKKDKGDE